MAKIPTPKRPKRPHLPALKPASFDVFMRSLESLPISRAAKTAVQQSMTVATNPNAESPDAVIRAMDTETQRSIRQAQASYVNVLASPVNRGKAALIAMTDDEFERLLNGSE